jgi:hypothetical protein
MLFGLTASTMAIAMAASAAQAQDVVVMRKLIAPVASKTGATPTPAPTPTPTPAQTPDASYYSWVVTGWQQQSAACGSQGVETRDVACRRTDGLVADDAKCTGNGSGPKPVASRPATITATCTFKWLTSDFSAPTTSCGTSVRTRDVSCVRSDGSQAPSASCPQPAPAASENTTDYSGCSYAWTTSAWTGPTTRCGTSTETRTVACQRSDGAATTDDRCATAGPRPDASQDVQVTEGCTAAWTTGDYGAPTPACGATTKTRSVTCLRQDGTTVADSQCSGDRPAATAAATDYTACTDGRTPDHPYNWTTGAWTPPSTTCGDATATRAVQCLDESGATAPDASCAGPRPDATRSSHETSGCTFAWTAGDFGAAQPACGATVQTRTVACVRSDGAPAADDSCDASARPSASRPATDVSACTFGWATDAWSDWSTTCGAATRTRSVRCQRSDGVTAPDSSCPAARPETAQNSYQTVGCGLSWSTGDYGAATPACGASVQTRSVSCLRSDGQTVDDAQCAQIGTKPDASKATTDYSTCSYSWQTGAYTAPSTTCGTSTQTRSVTCQRSDGQTVADASCTTAKPETSQTTAQTSGCTYDWSPGAWGAAAPACGASTHARTVTCMRSDGTVAPEPSACTRAKPATSEATTDYSTCSYSWSATNWAGTGGCGDTVAQNRTVTCQRSNGDDVTAANSAAFAYCPKSTMPAATQTITDYSACSYSWKVTNGAWSSTCSSAATRTNAVVCQRQDGTTVNDSYCSAARPATTETQAVYSSCTYAGTYGAPLGTCGWNSRTQTTTLSKCVRSDGADVTTANAAASYAYCAKASTQACTPTLTPVYGAYGTCTPTSQGATTGTETATLTSCQAEDGTSLSPSSCSSSPATTTTSCTITAYNVTAGSYGACTATSSGSSTGTQTAPVTACSVTASDGHGGTVANSLCKAPTQNCNMGLTCGALTKTTNGSTASAWGIDSSGYTKLGTASSVSAAQSICTSAAVGKTAAFLCGFNLEGTSVYTWGSTNTTSLSATNTLYLTTCK